MLTASTDRNIIVIKKYNGNEVTDEYLEKHPEILALLPKKEEVLIEYHSLKQKTVDGKTSRLEISENAIKSFANIM